jgi:hypothetical protein
MRTLIFVTIFMLMASCGRYITSSQALYDASLPNLVEWNYVGTTDNVKCYQNETGIKYVYENKEKIFAIIWITDTENGDDYRFFLEESGYMLGKTTDDQDVYYSPETKLLVFFTDIENVTQIEIYPFKEK